MARQYQPWRDTPERFGRDEDDRWRERGNYGRSPGRGPEGPSYRGSGSREFFRDSGRDDYGRFAGYGEVGGSYRDRDRFRPFEGDDQRRGQNFQTGWDRERENYGRFEGFGGRGGGPDYQSGRGREGDERGAREWARDHWQHGDWRPDWRSGDENYGERGRDDDLGERDDQRRLMGDDWRGRDYEREYRGDESRGGERRGWEDRGRFDDSRGQPARRDWQHRR